MENESNIKELKLSYCISIVISLIGLVSYIVFDFFSTVRTTFWPEIAYKATAELFFSWSLILIILFFLTYIFLEGLQFTENDFLKNLSNKSSKFYNLGSELTFLIMPMFIFLILLSLLAFFFPDNICYLYLLVTAAVLYLAIALKCLCGDSYKKFLNLTLIFIFLILTYLGFFGFMQLITADVNINFDQNYYRTNDYVIITIDKSGITPPEIIEVVPNNVFLKSVTQNETEQITSNKGIKKVVIYKIDNSLDFENFNYKTVKVNVNYLVKFLWYEINGTKAASFIILN